MSCRQLYKVGDILSPVYHQGGLQGFEDLSHLLPWVLNSDGPIEVVFGHLVQGTSLVYKEGLPKRQHTLVLTIQEP